MPFFNPSSGGSVEGQPINPSSIGATTPGPAAFTTINGELKHPSSTIGVTLQNGGTAGGHVTTFVFGNASFGAGNGQDLEFASYGYRLLSCVFTGNPNTTFWNFEGGLTTKNSIFLNGTYTSSTDYERLSSKYDPTLGVFIIQAEKGASGGVLRPVIFKDTPVPFADLPSAAAVGDGAHAFINDSNLSYNSLNIGSAVSGGGANSTPVIVIGGAWVVG